MKNKGIVYSWRKIMFSRFFERCIKKNFSLRELHFFYKQNFLLRLTFPQKMKFLIVCYCKPYYPGQPVYIAISHFRTSCPWRLLISIDFWIISPNMGDFNRGPFPICSVRGPLQFICFLLYFIGL